MIGQFWRFEIVSKARKGKPGHRVKREPQRWAGKPCGKAEEYCERESPPAVPGESYQAEYSERGKATDKGKALTEIRSSQRQLVPDTVGSDQPKPTSRRGIVSKANADKRIAVPGSLDVRRRGVFV
jgi:hypothetical protein